MKSDMKLPPPVNYLTVFEIYNSSLSSRMEGKSIVDRGYCYVQALPFAFSTLLKIIEMKGR